MKYILITGVSTGIGFETASDLIKRGFHVLGSVRNPSDATKLKQKLGDSFTPLEFDVTDTDAIDRCLKETKDIINGNNLSAIINNAGIAEFGPLMHLDANKVRHQFDVNVFGLLQVTRTFFPLLKMHL